MATSIKWADGNAITSDTVLRWSDGGFYYFVPTIVVSGFNVDIKVGGVFKGISTAAVKVGGTWKSITAIKLKVAGVWKVI